MSPQREAAARQWRVLFRALVIVPLAMAAAALGGCTFIPSNWPTVECGYDAAGKYRCYYMGELVAPDEEVPK